MLIKQVADDTNFIFKKMTDITGFDLWDSTVGALLDNMYVNQHSGLKDITEYIETLATENDDNKLSTTQVTLLANMIYVKYKRAWEQYFSYLEAEYDPITNYDMVEEETPDITRTIDSSQTSDITTTNSRNSFNSATMVDVDKSQTEGDSESNLQNSTETETGSRILTRKGNIGVTTTGQILKIDADFWSNWNYIESMFKDVDRFLTVGLY